MSAVASSPAAVVRPTYRNRLQRLLNSSIGLKLLMAFTGVILSGFVLVHMLGNLQAFQGEEAIDAYGKLLRKEPALLWTARLGLLGAVGLHIWSYFALMKKNQKARPVAYQGRKYREASLASLSMTVTGPLLLLFIVYHILHMTVGVVHPSFEEGAVYHNLVTGLTGVVGLIYVAAMVMLALHLWHGVWSLFQTLGVSEARFDSVGRTFATVFTLVVTIGFALIPLAVMAGVFRLP